MLPFFVYGTLLPNQPNAYLWQGKIRSIEPATLTGGFLYDMGYFPMFILEDGGEPVIGAVLTPDVNEYAGILTGFDQLEGYNPYLPNDSQYRRVAHTAHLADGSEKAVWVYVGNERYIAGMSPLPHNNWLTHAASKNSEIERWWANFESLFPNKK
jgi:gamma-glutamylcyclotransferase (GGCT)/AIG2-like uncharacterized protein YtfP